MTHAQVNKTKRTTANEGILEIEAQSSPQTSDAKYKLKYDERRTV